MKRQKLQNLLMLLLLMVVGAGNVWANDTNYAVYNETNSTGYTSLSDAIADATDDTETVIYVNSDITLSAGINFTEGTSGVNTKKLITILAGADNVTIKSGITGRIFTVNSGSAYLRLGDDTHRLIIDGDNKSYNSGFISIEKDKSGSGSTKNYFLTNVTIKNVKSTGSAGSGYVYQKKNNGHANMVFKNVTFDNCQLTNTSSSEGIVRYLRDATLYLEGTINFNDCTGTAFYLDTKKCVLRNNSSTLSDLTIENPIQVKVNSSAFEINQNVLVLFSHANAAKVSLVNEDRGLEDKGNGSTNGDVKLREAYTLNVSSYGDATLILPFESTIPTDVTAYTLNYTAGNASAKATEVETTLAENTPVFVVADEGKYKFVSKATTAATGSGTYSVGALTGVYALTTVPAGSYILWADATNPIGFYSVTGTQTVAANRAYLTADGAGARVMIDFDGGSTTAIEQVENQYPSPNIHHPIYNLAGQRVGKSYKGVVIQNGKKYFVK